MPTEKKLNEGETTQGIAAEGTDIVAEALKGITGVAEGAADDSLELAKESREAGAERSSGATVRELVASGRARQIFDLAEGSAKRLRSAASVLRGAMVRQLQSEGEGVSAISRLFGVSHQRISVLLRRGAPKGSR